MKNYCTLSLFCFIKTKLVGIWRNYLLHDKIKRKEKTMSLKYFGDGKLSLPLKKISITFSFPPALEISTPDGDSLVTSMYSKTISRIKSLFGTFHFSNYKVNNRFEVNIKLDRTGCSCVEEKSHKVHIFQNLKRDNTILIENNTFTFLFELDASKEYKGFSSIIDEHEKLFRAFLQYVDVGEISKISTSKINHFDLGFCVGNSDICIYLEPYLKPDLTLPFPSTHCKYLKSFRNEVTLLKDGIETQIISKVPSEVKNASTNEDIFTLHLNSSFQEEKPIDASNHLEIRDKLLLLNKNMNEYFFQCLTDNCKASWR